MKLQVAAPFVVATFLLAWLSSDATEQFALWFWAFVSGIIACFLSGAFYVKMQRQGVSAWNGAIILGSLFIAASICLTQWPLRLCYTISKPAMNSLASQLRNGKTIITPCQAGVFTIQKAEIRNNNTVCLWTEPNPSGDEGFVQCAPNNVRFNLWSMTTLDNQWQFISED